MVTAWEQCSTAHGAGNQWVVDERVGRWTQTTKDPGACRTEKRQRPVEIATAIGDQRKVHQGLASATRVRPAMSQIKRGCNHHQGMRGRFAAGECQNDGLLLWQSVPKCKQRMLCEFPKQARIRPLPGMRGSTRAWRDTTRLQTQESWRLRRQGTPSGGSHFCQQQNRQRGKQRSTTLEVTEGTGK